MNKKEDMSEQKQDLPVWLITGCSTGIGREIARAALEGGSASR